MIAAEREADADQRARDVEQAVRFAVEYDEKLDELDLYVQSALSDIERRLTGVGLWRQMRCLVRRLQTKSSGMSDAMTSG